MYNAGKHLRGRKQVDFDATDFLQQSQIWILGSPFEWLFQTKNERTINLMVFDPLDKIRYFQ